MSEKELDSAKYRKKRSVEPLLELPDFVTEAPPPAMSATLDASFRDVPLINPDGEAGTEEEELEERPSLSSMARQADTAVFRAWRTTLDDGAGITKGPKTGHETDAPLGPRGASYYAAALAHIHGGIKKSLKTGLQKGGEEEGAEAGEKELGERPSLSSLARREDADALLASDEEVEELLEEADALMASHDEVKGAVRKFGTQFSPLRSSVQIGEDADALLASDGEVKQLLDLAGFVEEELLDLSEVVGRSSLGDDAGVTAGADEDWPWIGDISGREGLGPGESSLSNSGRDRSWRTAARTTSAYDVEVISERWSQYETKDLAEESRQATSIAVVDMATRIADRQAVEEPTIDLSSPLGGSVGVGLYQNDPNNLEGLEALGDRKGINALETDGNSLAAPDRAFNSRSSDVDASVQGGSSSKSTTDYVKTRLSATVTHRNSVSQNEYEGQLSTTSTKSDHDRVRDEAHRMLQIADSCLQEPPCLGSVAGEPSGSRGASYYSDAPADIRGGINKGLETGLQKGREGGEEEEDADARAGRASFSSEEGDLEALAAKACALASAPIPDYADTFARLDQRYKTKKHWDPWMARETIKASKRKEKNPKYVQLAGKTSDILSEFQDYLDVIESQPSKESILEHKSIGVTTETGEDRGGVVLTEWNWEDKFSDRPNYKRRASIDRNLYTGDASVNTISLGDGDSAGSPGDEKKRYRYTCPSQHSKKFKVAALWVILFIVLLGAFIGITSSGRTVLSQNSETDSTPLPHHVVGLPADKAPNQSDVAEKVSSTQKNEDEGAKTALSKDEGSPTTQTSQPDAKPLPHHVVSLPADKAPNQSDVVQKVSSAPKGETERAKTALPKDEESPTTLGPDLNGQDGAAPSKDEPTGNSTSSVVSATSVALPNGTPNDAQDGAQQGGAQQDDEGDGNGSEQILAEPIAASSSQMRPASPPNEPMPALARPTTPVSGHTPQGELAYQKAIETYHPRGYDRATGWEGVTYREAGDFCEGKHRVLCPFDAVCPLGTGGLPFGGYLDGEKSWVPISDGSNDWVNLGEEWPCLKYSAMYVHPPEWGATGKGGEGVTGHVVCCQAAYGDGPTLVASTAPILTPTPGTAMTLGSIVEIVEAHPSILELAWYDRSSGWKGRTYNEAFSFCAERGPGYDLCPYESYCPVPNGIPYGGAKDEGPSGSWAPISDSFNDWVQVGAGDSCVSYSTLHSHHPDWGLTGAGSEDLTRHIACCRMGKLGEGTASSKVETENTSVIASENTGSPGTLEEDSTSVSNLDYPSIIEKYAPKWYQRYDGTDDEWLGSSYTDAIVHCAQRNSTIPCPYEAYCPNGPGSTPLLGSRVSGPEQEESWAPIMDIPNGWVNVGLSSDSCKLYNSLHHNPPLWGLGVHHSDEVGSQLREGNAKDATSHIMCCRKPPEGLGLVSQTSVPPGRVPVANTKYELDILDKKHPVWFSREHGYRGTTHDEAVDFCKNIGDMVLCPADTYCPHGNTDPDRPLFLQNPAFEGEQWAPVATTSTSLNEKWLLIGKIGGYSSSTCSSFGSVRGMKPDGWDLDDEDPEMKKHVMCCLNPNQLLRETNFAKDLDPTWLDESFGWKGGSHDDAVDFCRKFGNKKLCPYTAYCPHGPGQPVIGGHPNDFNIEGEQWAPVHRNSNYWVMIGQKYGNSATTCMDNWQLEGAEPSWGTSNERADLKKHIMCCDF